MEEMNALLARRSGTIKKNLNIKVISFFLVWKVVLE